MPANRVNGHAQLPSALGVALAVGQQPPPAVLSVAKALAIAKPMPLILFKRKRVLYWGDADQPMDFTTMDDTAAFTASAAFDPLTPRFLRIAGDQLSTRELTAVVSEVTGKKFRLFRAGGLGMLDPLDNGRYPVFVGRGRGMCSQRVKVARVYDRLKD
jgi:nucleoside-diphosphate-sugar epimerase